MRIGILTQPLSRNYGGILQNYALQQVLKKMGHEPYTFDLGLYTWKDWFIITIKCIIKKIIGRPCVFQETPIQKKNQECILRRFVDKYIDLLSPRCCRPTKKQIEKYNLDVIIVGSDQVWRPGYNHPIEKMYLDFAESMNMKKVAYAVSFGTSDWEYNEEQTSKCKKLAQKFDAVSVREDSGVDLCGKYLNVSAIHVLDPTLLLSSNDYNNLLEEIPQNNSRILFAYILDITEEKLSFLKRESDRLSLTLIIKSSGKCGLIENDSVEKWLSYFRDCQFVITDSFHGLVFSLIYNKEFVVIGNQHRGLDRMVSILNKLNLICRLVKEDALHITKVQEEKVDWFQVNRLLDRERSYSILFLNEKVK